MRINLGSGADRRDNYVNVDAFAPEADLRSDLCNLGMRSRSVSEIYCSHVLEHLNEIQVLDAFREMHRLLRPPEGKVVILVPDFQWCLENWFELPESQRWGWAIDTIFGNQNHEGEYHRTGFTVDRMRRLLEKSGFAIVKVDTVFSHGMRSIRAVAETGAVKPSRRPEPNRRVTQDCDGQVSVENLPGISGLNVDHKTIAFPQGKKSVDPE